MENWLEADPENVACMHCLTGKGRPATILACYLTWAGEASSVMEALQFVATRRGGELMSHSGQSVRPSVHQAGRQTGSLLSLSL